LLKASKKVFWACLLLFVGVGANSLKTATKSLYPLTPVSVPSSPPLMHPNDVFHLGILWGNSLTVADFDGDHQPDVALGSFDDSRFSVRVQLSSQAAKMQLEPIVYQMGIRLFALDIDHDSSSDLIAILPSTHQPLAIWLGNGKGQFRKANLEYLDNPFNFNFPDSLEGSCPVFEITLLDDEYRFSMWESLFHREGLCLNPQQTTHSAPEVFPIQGLYALPLLRSPPALSSC
jgi:hypothetical protein